MRFIFQHFRQLKYVLAYSYCKLNYTVRHLSGYLHLVRDLCSTECLCFSQCSCNAAFPLRTQMRKTTKQKVGIRGDGGLCIVFRGSLIFYAQAKDIKSLIFCSACNMAVNFYRQFVKGNIATKPANLIKKCVFIGLKYCRPE